MQCMYYQVHGSVSPMRYQIWYFHNQLTFLSPPSALASKLSSSNSAMSSESEISESDPPKSKSISSPASNFFCILSRSAGVSCFFFWFASF